MQLDCNRYRHYVDRFDMPEEQKDALLQQVWAIMGSFVDRAFGHAPEQQLPGLGRERPALTERNGASATTASDTGEPKSCEKAHRELAHQPKTALDCQKPLTPIFNDAAEPKPPARKTRR